MNRFIWLVRLVRGLEAFFWERGLPFKEGRAVAFFCYWKITWFGFMFKLIFSISPGIRKITIDNYWRLINDQVTTVFATNCFMWPVGKSDLEMIKLLLGHSIISNSLLNPGLSNIRRGSASVRILNILERGSENINFFLFPWRSTISSCTSW